jgi:hypothetical protein
LVYSECVGGEKYFVVRYKKTHGKHDLCRAFFKTCGKEREKFAPPLLGANGSPSVSTGGDGRLDKKFDVRYAKTHGKLKGLPCVPKKRTATKLFAVHPIENARQRFSRTTKLGFPIVIIYSYIYFTSPA